MDKEIKTQRDQMSLWHKKCADLLNLVVSVKTHLHTKQTAHVVLFSREVNLGYAQVIAYDRWRFQLEGHFRDAQQYWGLEDCMSVKARPVDNSANLAMFMVKVSQALMRPMRGQWPAFSVHDLKAWFRGQQYVVETLQWLPEPPNSLFIDQVVAPMAALGRINHAVNPA
jgi:hypothetical protein